MVKYKKLLIATILGVIFLFTLNHFIPTKSQAAQNKLKNNITFFIASDVHFFSKKLTDNKESFNNYLANNDGKQIDYISEIFDCFIDTIEQSKPDFIIISGDLTVNGEKDSHLDFSNKLNTIEKLGVSVFVVPGNHDINNPNARGFSENKKYKVTSITPNEFAEIYKPYGFEEAISKDSNSLSYLVTPSPGLWLLMLDTNNYNNNYALGSPQTNGYISPGTIKWIKECSKKARNNNAEIMVVAHHNFSIHNSFLHKNFTLDNYEEVIDTLNEINTKLSFSGHIHHQHIQEVNKNNNTLYDVSSSSLAVFPQKFGILTYSKPKNLDYSTATLDLESWAKKTSSTDTNLLNFKSYSKNLLTSTSYKFALRLLNQSMEFSEDENILIAKTVAEIRANSFDNFDNFNLNELISSSEFDLIKSSQSKYLQYYSNLVLKDLDKDNDSLHIK